MITILPREPTGGQRNIAAISQLLNTIQQIKQQRRADQMRESILSGGGLPSFGQPEGGFFDQLIEAVNPMTPSRVGTTTIEDLIMKERIQGLYGDPFGVERARAKSYTAAAKARLRPKKPKAPKRYDIKTLGETLYDWTHNKEGNYVEPTKANLFMLKKMARDSGCKLRKATTQEIRAKKRWYLPEFLEGTEKVPKTMWVLEDKQGNIEAPVEPAQRQTLPVTPETPIGGMQTEPESSMAPGAPGITSIAPVTAPYTSLADLGKQPTPLTAINPKTGERIISYDGGKTWKPAP